MRWTDFKLKEDSKKLKDLQQKLATVPPNVSERFLATIERAIELARDEGSSPGENLTTQLKSVEDNDMKSWYKYIAKEIVGHELSYNEIKSLLDAINNDKVINLGEFAKVDSDIQKIIPLFNKSENLSNFFKDLFNTTPQRIGPAEIMFIVMSKSITKGSKGDLQVGGPIGKEVEVKAGKTSGRFRDGDVTKLQDPKLRQLQRQFLEKYPSANKAGHNLSSTLQLTKNNDYDINEITNEVMQVFDAIFPGSSYRGQFLNNFKGGNLEQLQLTYGLANLEMYFQAKGGKAMAFLFINASKNPFQTCYIGSYEDIASGLQAGSLAIKVEGFYMFDQTGNNEEYPKIGIFAK